MILARSLRALVASSSYYSSEVLQPFEFVSLQLSTSNRTSFNPAVLSALADQLNVASSSKHERYARDIHQLIAAMDVISRAGVDTPGDAASARHMFKARNVQFLSIVRILSNYY